MQALRRFERRYVVRSRTPCWPGSGGHFQSNIRTLDAVHLATAELLGEPPPLMTIVTSDDRVRDNAVALGCAIA